MKIKLVKIKKHWWCPLMTKEIILSITPDLPLKQNFKIKGKTEKNEEIISYVETKEESYIQPMCNNWELTITNGKVKDVQINY